MKSVGLSAIYCKDSSSLDSQTEIPIIQADKQWAIKCQQFPDRSTSIFGAPGAGMVSGMRDPFTKRPVAQGIISSRFY